MGHLLSSMAIFVPRDRSAANDPFFSLSCPCFKSHPLNTVNWLIMILNSLVQCTFGSCFVQDLMEYPMLLLFLLSSYFLRLLFPLVCLSSWNFLFSGEQNTRSAFDVYLGENDLEIAVSWCLYIFSFWNFCLYLQLKTEQDLKKQRFREAYMSLYF